jgi:hypothetical protein
VSISPDSIQVGQCYLLATGQVKRVLALLPSGRVHYEYRFIGRPLRKTWQPGTQEVRAFAALVERPVASDWTPESEAP